MTINGSAFNTSTAVTEAELAPKVTIGSKTYNVSVTSDFSATNNSPVVMFAVETGSDTITGGSAAVVSVTDKAGKVHTINTVINN